MCLKSVRFIGSQSISLKNKFAPKTYNGPKYEDILRIRSTNLVPCIKSHFKSPLLINEGHMQWLYDHKGKKFLDMFGGIVTVSVGHCHPKINEALKKQMETLWHTTNIYMHPKIHEYAEALAAKFPGDLKVVYFVNSGSEANDLAAMMARIYTGNHDLIVLRNSYHGGASSTIGMTGQGTWKFPLPTYSLHYAKNPDIYKGQFGGKNCRNSPIQTQRDCNCSADSCDAAQHYAEDVEEIIQYSIPKKGVAGFVAESIQGVGGAVQYPRGYLAKVYQLVRDHGGICIADEVQTGFGRTGSDYWGFQNHSVTPDIVTMAKGIGNGFPLAALITTPSISKSLTKALHFNTFGGNPLASAVGLKVIQVIDEEKLQENCEKVGNYLLKKLNKLRDEFEVVGDVRGKGLMIGIEMVENKTSKKPLDSDTFAKIWENCKDLGVLIGVGGLKGNVFRIKPPMCISQQDADSTYQALHTSIKQVLNTN